MSGIVVVIITKVDKATFFVHFMPHPPEGGFSRACPFEDEESGGSGRDLCFLLLQIEGVGLDVLSALGYLSPAGQVRRGRAGRAFTRCAPA